MKRIFTNRARAIVRCVVLFSLLGSVHKPLCANGQVALKSLSSNGSIEGIVFEDQNNDGALQNGEGMDKISLRLSGTTDDGRSVSRSKKTNNDGEYKFDGLASGTYTVAIDESTLPPSLRGDNTVDPDNDYNGESTVVLAEGETFSDLDFGYFSKHGSIGDRIFEDEDESGFYTWPEGVSGVTVTLTGTDIDGNSVNLTDVSGFAGNYVFNDLEEGNYTISVDESTLPARLRGEIVVSSDNRDDSVADEVLEEGEINADLDFGYLAPVGTIGDRVYEDLNNNGAFDDGEGLDNIKVTLSGTDVDSEPVDHWVTTDATGHYMFELLIEGEYTITVDESTLPAHLHGHNTDDPDDNNDSNTTIELGDGEDNMSAVFGYFNASFLPVELISFDLQVEEQGVKLSWSTASEVNNDFFEIQRSHDGIAFEKLSTIKGVGNSLSTVEYSYDDLYPESGENYYRLKQVDIDGQFSYSPVRKVFFSSLEKAHSEYSINIYPNPVVSRLSIECTSDQIVASDARLQIFNALGTKIIEFDSSKFQTIDVTQLSEGFYAIVIINEKGEVLNSEQFLKTN